MAFAAPNQGYGSPVFHPTQAPYASSTPINPRLLLLHQLLRSPDGNTYNHPNFGFHHFVPAQPGGTVPAPGTPPNMGFGHLPTPVPVPATGIAPPSEPGGVPGPTPNDPRLDIYAQPAYPDGGGGATPDSLAAVQALQDQVNAQPHPAVNANIAAVQAAHEQARALAAHIANRRVLRPVRLRRGRQVM